MATASYKVKDINLSDWGRKEMDLAEAKKSFGGP